MRINLRVLYRPMLFIAYRMGVPMVHRSSAHGTHRHRTRPREQESLILHKKKSIFIFIFMNFVLMADS